MESIYKSDVAIVGSGISGLMTAISLYPRKVTIVTKRKIGEMSSSAWAQGGIAASVTKNDNPEIHYHDTIKASSGLSDKSAVKVITEEANSIVQFLEEIGVKFDKQNGEFSLSKEAAHTYRRVLKINGDQSGKFLVEYLIKYLKKQGHATIVEDVSVDHIIQKDNVCHGIMGHIHKDEVVDNFVFFQAPNIILATGGIGSVYAHTTNPRDVYGEAIAMAATAGADLVDLEFVQFHPTALDVGLDPAPLLTEAIRGEGAYIVDENNHRFVFDEHKDGELAPRDVVSRAIHKHKLNGHSTFLDCRHFQIDFEKQFPTAQKYLNQASINPKKDLIPIIPAAHYHMGGIKVDLDGKTSVNGLWACGECSSTGAHGANRLASNSLLEAFVYAKRIANKINSEPPKQSHKIIDLENYIPKEKTISKIRAKKYIWQLRSAMHKFVGVERNYANLNQAFVEFFRIEREAESLSAKLKDMLMVSKLITFAAMKRNESRGTHFRSDYPKKNEHEAKRNVFQLKDLNDYINQEFKKAN
jgi:L-aspartate oxidase